MSDIYVWDGSDLLPAVPPIVRTVGEPPPPPGAPSEWSQWRTTTTWGGTTHRPLMGVYLGNHNETPDQVYYNNVGVYPDICTQYYQAWQRPGGTINRNAENARLARGTVCLMTVTAIGSPWTHAQIAAGQADEWIEYWASNLATLNPGEIWFTFDHEFEVKRNHSQFGWTPTNQDYANAFNRWKSIVKAARPDIKFIYWYGYARESEINAIGGLLNSPDMIALDPYVFAHHSASTTFEQMAEPKLTWLRNRSWYEGQPIFFAEYAKDKAHGDSQMASFYTDLRDRMTALELYGAVLFCRDKTGLGEIQANIITNNSYPLAKAAYAASANDT